MLDTNIQMRIFISLHLVSYSIMTAQQAQNAKDLR